MPDKNKDKKEKPAPSKGLPYFDNEKQRDLYRKQLTDVVYQELNKSDNSDLLLSTSYYKTADNQNCINGVCGLSIKAGFRFNNPADEDRYLSGVKFSDAVNKGDEDFYQVNGNFQVGDIMQYRNKKNPRSHNKMIYDISTDANGEKQYYVVDNGGTTKLKSRKYSEKELKDLMTSAQGTNYDYVNYYRPGLSLDSEKLAQERKDKMSPEAIAALEERKKLVEYEKANNKNYVYGVRPDSKYAKAVPVGMQKFFDFANNPDKIQELVEKTGVEESVIHDELLNVFGQLGQENKWEDRGIGGSFGVENTIERLATHVFGGGKNLSVGPGQIKFNQVTPQLRKTYGINSAKDLHDFDKVIPLMAAMNVENRKWLERKGEEASAVLTGTPGTRAQDLPGGQGRYTAYMYQGLPRNPVETLQRKAEENRKGYRYSAEDAAEHDTNFINDRLPALSKNLGKGSYAEKVMQNIDTHLQRTMPVDREVVMPEIIIRPKKQITQQPQEAGFFARGGVTNSNTMGTFIPLTESLGYNAKGLQGSYSNPGYLDYQEPEQQQKPGQQKDNSGLYSNIAGAATRAITGTASALSAPNDPNNPSARGEMIGSTVLGAVGGIFGEGFGAIGNWLGGEIGGMFGPNAPRRQEGMWKVKAAQNRQFNPMYESDIRGENSAFYAEEGMMIPSSDMSNHSMSGETPTIQPELQPLNVQKGEILVDAQSLKVIRKFDNPNRYTKHEKNPMKEPMGNFVQVPAGSVVIPADKTKAYEAGNNLTKQSIIREILKGQEEDPMQNAPRGVDAMYMAPGGEVPWGDPYNFTDFAKNRAPQYFEQDPKIPIDYNNDPYAIRNESPFINAPGKIKPMNGNFPFKAPPAPAGTPAETPPPAGNTGGGFGSNLGEYNWGLIGANAAQFIPTVAGYINSMKGDPHLRYNDNREGYDRAIGEIGSGPTKPSTEAAKAAAGNAFGRVRQMYTQMGTPSAASNVANAQAQLIGRVGEIEENAVNAQMQNEANKRNAIAGLQVQKGADQLQNTQRFQDELRGDAATRENLQQAYLSEGVTNAIQMQMDRERLAVMNQMTNVFKLNPYMKQMIQEKPDVVENFIIPEILGMNAFPATPTSGRSTNINGRRVQTKYNRNNQYTGRTITDNNTNITR